MKLITTATIALLATSFTLSAGPTRHYQNVPSLTVDSDTFKILDGRSTLEAARQQCEREIYQATRLLQQKGVDIILETTPCTLYEKSLEASVFSATVYFIN